MDYQLIAVDAVDRGLLEQSKFNRTQVVQNIEQYHKEKLESRPLPLECMDQVSLETFLAESMRLERELVPDFLRLMRNSIKKELLECRSQEQVLFRQHNSSADRS
jgi:hypothetical protein